MAPNSNWDLEVGRFVRFLNPGDLMPTPGEWAEWETVKRQIDWMKAHPLFHFTIEGHCSEDEGDRVECLNLGKERAGTMANWYVSYGIDRSRLHTISYGKERPRSLNHLDRRVETWPQ